MTAHDDAETRALASKAGAIGFFRKPVDADALLDAITWAMRGAVGRLRRGDVPVSEVKLSRI